MVDLVVTHRFVSTVPDLPDTGIVRPVNWNDTHVIQNGNGLAPLASPVLTGIPTAPNPAAGDISTQIATTAFVAAAISSTGLIPVVAIGANLTYTDTQIGKIIVRSNSGAVMFDTLQGATAGAIASGGAVTVYNGDAQAFLEIRAGAGSTLDGATTNFILIGPKQCCSFVSDGTNYRSVLKPDRARAGASFIIYCDAVSGNDNNSGIDASHAFRTLEALWTYVVHNIHLNNFGITIKLANGTYEGAVFAYLLTGWNVVGLPFILLEGNVIDNTLVIIHSTTGIGGIHLAGLAYLYIRGVTLTAAAGNCIATHFWSFLTVLDQVRFGAGAASHIRAESCSRVYLNNNYGVAAGAQSHYTITDGAAIFATPGILLVPSPGVTWTSAMATVSSFGYLSFFATVTVAMTGNAVLVDQNGGIKTDGSLQAAFGCSAPGTVTAPGWIL